MLVCDGCARHVMPSENSCPFCGQALGADLAPRASATLGAAVVACLGLGSACGPGTDTTTETTVAGTETSAGPTDSSSGPTSDAQTTAAATSSSSLTDATMSTGLTDESTSTTDYTDPCNFYAGCPPEDFFNDLACDPWSQDCPVEEKCVPYDENGDNVWDALQCVPVDPAPVGLGEPCSLESLQSGVDTCELGAICWDVDPQTQQGVCVAQCTGSIADPQCPPGTGCVIANEGVLTLCLDSCDPLMMDCDEDELCLPNANDGDETFVCVLAGDSLGDEDDPCELLNTCAPGHLCVSADQLPTCAGDACCTPFCDLSEPDTCAAPKACTAVYDPPPEGYEQLGVCVSP